MARVSLLEKDQVNEKLNDVFQKIEDSGRHVLNIFKAVANCPQIGRDFLRLGNSILTKGRLEPHLRELAILRVGTLTECQYEWIQHVPLGRMAGLTDTQIDTIFCWQDSTCFNLHEQAILKYTDDVVQNVRASEETFQAVSAFLDDEQLVELTITVGYYSMVCRVLESLEIELEDKSA